MEEEKKYQELGILDLVKQFLKGNAKTAERSDEDGGIVNSRKSRFRALEFAYDTKYGNWGNVDDLRRDFVNWHEPISSKIGKIESKEIVVLGSNNGNELPPIFGEEGMRENNFLLIDISRVAIDIGKKRFEQLKNIVFKQAEINRLVLERDKYDICLSLRTVHSTGIDLERCVNKCYKITKPEGQIILSVSNGYLNEGAHVIGMYDHETGTINKQRPYDIANKIEFILSQKRIKGEIKVIEGNSEIFIYAVKAAPKYAK